MARTAITVQEMTADGLTVTFSEISTDGAKFTNDGRTFLLTGCHASSEARQIALVSQLAADGDSLATEDRRVLLLVSCSSQTDELLIGPFKPSVYNVKSGTDSGKMYVYLSNTSSALLTPTFLEQTTRFTVAAVTW